jgi:hypothetical protein
VNYNTVVSEDNLPEFQMKNFIGSRYATAESSTRAFSACTVPWSDSEQLFLSAESSRFPDEARRIEERELSAAAEACQLTPSVSCHEALLEYERNDEGRGAKAIDSGHSRSISCNN